MGSEWNPIVFEEIYKESSKNGLTKPSKIRGEGTKFINMKEIFAYDRMLNIDCERVPLTKKEKQSSLLKPLDLLFARQSLVLEGAGKCSIFIGDEEPATFESHLIRVRINQELANPYFLYYFFKSPQGRGCIYAITEQGAGASGIRGSDLRGIPIPLPPLPEQKAITHIIGSLDDKIELNRRMNATLEGMAQALFKSWFVDFDPVIDNALAAGNPIPDELTERAEVRRKALADGIVNRETAKQFPASFQVTEEMGWIPAGWEVVTLNQAIQINPSLKLSKGTVAPFADMKALPTDGYSINGVIEKAYSGGAKFQNDDVLLARITPCLENGKTGIVDFLPSPSNVGFGSTEFIVLRGKGELSLPYVACLSREESFRLHCIQSMVGSSGRQRVQNACFDSFYVACATDLVVLKKFSEITQPMFQKSTEQAKQSRTLTKLRDTLLPKLISGELRIPEAEKLTKEALA